MEFARITDLKKCFEKWSHGTLYNRLEELGLKDNEMYMSNNKKMYNESAIMLLIDRYVDEFSVDKEKLKNYMMSILSSQDISNEFTNKENEKKQPTDKTDNIDKIKDVNNVKFVNDNYITKVSHNEIVKNLNEQIIFLKSQLENVNAINQTLTDTIKIKEQKELTIEQEKIFELQQVQTVKALESQEQPKNNSNKGKGIWALFRNIKNTQEDI